MKMFDDINSQETELLWRDARLRPAISVPSEQECFALLESRKTPVEVALHCAAVAGMAVRIAESLPLRRLDRALIKSAALLHDIARAEKNHARAGADFLISRGYPRVAEIVLSHHNLEPRDLEILTESTIVFYADKRICGTDEVTVEERFSRSLALCRTPEARASHRRQYGQALRAGALIEAAESEGKRRKRRG